MKFPTAFDEFPIHQSPLPIARAYHSDRNFYDRCYLNAHNGEGGISLVSGFGLYPNLRTRDAYLCLRQGNQQKAVRFSDQLHERTDRQQVGPYRIEVIEPLNKLRVICEHEELGADITWTGSFPALLEQPHVMLNGARSTLDAQRFCQVGSWEGTINVGSDTINVSPDQWVGVRDRSWGIRPVGESEPQGIQADLPFDGLWWLYVPMRFKDFALVVIIQEDPTGYRILNDVSRVFPDGRVEQLGWPRVEIDYVSGTRIPTGARLHMTTPAGEPLLVEIESKGYVPLHLGCGYPGDADWGHGQWRGHNWSQVVNYDFDDPEVMAKVQWGAIDHIGRATCNGEEGWGLFEHTIFGPHAPSGFKEWFDNAP